jgi:hypothetical protein
MYEKKVSEYAHGWACVCVQDMQETFLHMHERPQYTYWKHLLYMQDTHLYVCTKGLYICMQARPLYTYRKHLLYMQDIYLYVCTKGLYMHARKASVYIQENILYMQETPLYTYSKEVCMYTYSVRPLYTCKKDVTNERAYLKFHREECSELPPLRIHSIFERCRST